MKRTKFILLVLGMFCIFSSYGQEEFFGSNTGLTISGTTDFSSIYGGGLSLHLKNGLIFSSSSIYTSNYYYYIPTIITVGYLFDFYKQSEKNKFYGTLAISDITSLQTLFQNVRSISPTVGLMYSSYFNINYPTSFGLAASAYFEGLNFNNLIQSSLSFYVSQAFFANKNVYPVIGITYSLPILQSYGYAQGQGSFEFHVGLNIRISRSKNEKIK